jgi:hypothetical protein
MSIADKFRKSREASQKSNNSGGARKNVGGVFLNLEDGPNRVRLGKTFLMMEQHYIGDLIQDKYKGYASKDDDTPKFKSYITCLNWDIDNEEQTAPESHACPICDLKYAANKRLKSWKDSDADNKEEMIKHYKNIGGMSYPRMKFLWPALSRTNPFVTVTDESGNEEQQMGWKVLSLAKTAHESIETLYHTYESLFDPEEGCDIDVFKNKSGGKTSYSSSLALEGTALAISPLSEEELGLDELELKRFVSNYVSPRQLFLALKEEYQELITEELNKDSDDYPEDPMLTREPLSDSQPKEEKAVLKEDAPRQRPSNVADEFDDDDDDEGGISAMPIAEEEEEAPAVKKKSPPKPPRPPAPPKKS